MRLIVTADLHYDHGKSRQSADEIIAAINRTGCDLLLVVGDAAVSAGNDLERCLSAFDHPGPKLFVPGNHELWTLQGDSYALFTHELPARVRSLGWYWLQTQPFVAESFAIVGTIGWYDYSFAQKELGIPRRFYERKLSPGAAAMLKNHEQLLQTRDDILPHALEFGARWNDGRFVRLGRSDEEFLAELLQLLALQLCKVSNERRTVIAATHHLPFRELLPPSHNAHWDFVKAFLGSEKIGQLLLKFPAVSKVFCGHSHFQTRAQVGHIEAINIGSGYREKRFEIVEIE